VLPEDSQRAREKEPTVEAEERSIASVMREEFVSVASKDQLDFVDDVMKLGRIRHMPVVDEGRLVGVVSQRDLLAAALSKALDFDQGQRRNFLRSVQVSEVMSRQPITVQSDTTLSEATRTLLAHKIGCLPVLDAAERLVGLVTETDLLRGAYGLA
jgi:CBS domain-containing protein